MNRKLNNHIAASALFNYQFIIEFYTHKKSVRDFRADSVFCSNRDFIF